MKKILFLIVAAALSFAAKSQVIDSSITHILSVKIQPVYASIIDTVPSTRLGVRIEKDNLLDQAEIYWELLTDKGQTTIRSREIVTGDEYENWPADPEEVNRYPFIIVITKHEKYLKLDTTK
jgi:hypothetical protein